MTLADVLGEPLSPEQLHASVRARQRTRTQNAGLDLTQRVTFFRSEAADAIPALLRAANLALDGMLVLPGTGNRLQFVGNPPRWHENPTPDPEYIWSINRMNHWLSLLHAHALSGEPAYAQKVVSELDDWIAACPCPPINREPDAAYKAFYAVTPWRSLEAGIRMFHTWPHVIAHLIDTEFLTPGLLARMVVSLHEHAVVLADICPIFWPRADHNHYLMENLGLLAVSVMVPDLRNSGAWFRHAVRELERCAAAQLTADGGQIEGCPTYHNGCVYWFCLACRLASELNADGASPFSEEFNRRVARSLDYTVHSLRPTGVTVPWGDSDATDTATNAALWWYDTTRDATPLRVIAGLTGSASARERILELAWTLRDPAATLKELDAAPSTTPALAYWGKELSQVALRTSWNRDALSLFFACRSPVNNGHAHLDPMGFDFTAFGQPMLVDPGRYTYRECPERIVIKSATSHNTLTVNRREPFEYLSTWYFGPQQPGQITHVWDSPRFRAAAASQLNFQPVLHRRLVAIVDDRCLLVLDDLSGLAPDSSVQLYFNIDSMNVQWDPAARSARAVFPETSTLLAFASSDQPLAGRILDGKVSEVFDTWRDSKRIEIEDAPANGQPRRCYATVVLPAAKVSLGFPTLNLRVWHDSAAVHCAWDIDGAPSRFTWADTSATLE